MFTFNLACHWALRGSGELDTGRTMPSGEEEQIRPTPFAAVLAQELSIEGNQALRTLGAWRGLALRTSEVWRGSLIIAQKYHNSGTCSVVILAQGIASRTV